MSSRTCVVVALMAACLLALLACRPQEPMPSTDQPLAVLARATLEGPALDTAALAGKTVLVNFWSPT
jgi:biotin transporter BioY